MGRRYAKTTAVSISKSRDEIKKILQKWGAAQMQWSDDFDHGQTMLRFMWKHEEVDYTARFVIHMPSRADLEAECEHATSGQFLPAKFEKLQKRQGMTEHRELALWIKAMFVAVEAGLVKAEQVLLPFLEGRDGMTVGEVILPRLNYLVDRSSAKSLLERNP